MIFPIASLARRAGCAAVLVAMSMPALAAIRDSNICPSLANAVEIEAGRTIPDVCYSGFFCYVGLRGDWLDLTDEVDIIGLSPLPRVSIDETGADPRSHGCAPPSNRTREGFVVVRIQDITSLGRYRIKVSRVGNVGINRHSNSHEIEVRNGGNYLDLLSVNRQPFSMRAGPAREVELKGRGLELLRVKTGVGQPFPEASGTRTAPAAPGRGIAAAAAAMRTPISSARLPANAQVVSLEPAPFEIISARYDSVRIRVHILRPGIVRLEDYFEFASVRGVPTVAAINDDLGWPRFDVRP